MAWEYGMWSTTSHEGVEVERQMGRGEEGGWGKEEGRMRGSKKERNKQERIKKDGEKKHLFFTQVCS